MSKSDLRSRATHDLLDVTHFERARESAARKVLLGRAAHPKKLRHAALAVLLALLPAGCCTAPKANELLAAGKSAPRLTVAAFQTFARAESCEQEYRCFSSGFTRRNGLSMATYCEARERIRREQPLIDWLARASNVEFVRDEAVGNGRHRIDVRVAGRTVRIHLVREDFWRIERSDLFVDGLQPFETLVQIENNAAGEPVLVARLPLEAAEMDPATITSLVVEKLWKIDDIQPLDAP